MNWRVETRILGGFSLALALLLVMGALVYFESQALLAANRTAQRSHRAVTALDEILSLMSEAQADQRLYLLAGDAADRRLRDNALARVDRLVAELDGLAAAEPTLRARLPALHRALNERRNMFDRELAAQARAGATRRGFAPEARDMASLRDAVSHIQRAELASLGNREQTARAITNRTELFVVLLLGLAAVSVAILYVSITREMRARRSARNDLERQAAELRASEIRLRAVVDTATDGIIIIDHRGIVDRFNRAAERIFGYDAADVIGRNISMLMPSPDHEQHDGYLARYLDGAAPRIIGIGREVRARRKDGTTFPMDLAVSEMSVAGRRMFAGIVRDISERKRAEGQRAALIHELQSANDELQSFAYVVSHDLKAPLRAIGSLADWIDTDYRDRLDSEGREHLRLLRSRVRRMDALIDGILEYSRVGRVKEKIVAVSTERVIRETIDLLAPPGHIRVLIEEALPTVTAEPTRLRQVFQNLLSNAIKCMDKAEGIIRVGCRPVGDMWQFSVADNGPGIETRHHTRIFQLFQTLTPRDRIESTGVGLTLVKKIVELYGGRVWLESARGDGTTFYFTLPREVPAASPTEKVMP